MAHPEATKEEMLEKFGSIEDRLQKDPAGSGVRRLTSQLMVPRVFSHQVRVFKSLAERVFC